MDRLKPPMPPPPSPEMNDTADHSRLWGLIVLVCLLVACFVGGYFFHDYRQKCPPLTSEVMLYVSFLPTAGTTYCDLPPDLQLEVDQARAAIEAKHQR
jgi:hypothetical protein